MVLLTTVVFLMAAALKEEISVLEKVLLHQVGLFVLYAPPPKFHLSTYHLGRKVMLTIVCVQ